MLPFFYSNNFFIFSHFIEIYEIFLKLLKNLILIIKRLVLMLGLKKITSNSFLSYHEEVITHSLNIL